MNILDYPAKGKLRRVVYCVLGYFTLLSCQWERNTRHALDLQDFSDTLISRWYRLFHRRDLQNHTMEEKSSQTLALKKQPLKVWKRKTCVNVPCGYTTIAAYAGKVLQLVSREVPQMILYQCGVPQDVGCSVFLNWLSSGQSTLPW